MMREIDIYLLALSAFRPSSKLPKVLASEVAVARESGVVRPIMVRPLPGTTPMSYEIVEGVKTWLVAQRAGISTITAEVVDLTDDEVRRLLKAESRKQNDYVAESHFINGALADESGLTITKLADREAMNRSTASHLLRLARLTPAVRTMWEQGDLEKSHVRPLVTLPPVEQVSLAKRIVREGLSVRAIEQAVRELRGVAIAAPKTVSAVKPETRAKDTNILRVEELVSEQCGVKVSIRDDVGQLVFDYCKDNEILAGLFERMGIKGF